MNTKLLIKEIQLMLKDLKFQIFFLILVLLFILSAISSSVTYRNVSEHYQRTYNSHNERKADDHSMSLVNLLSGGHHLFVNSKPSPAVLFSNYPAYPDRVVNQILYFNPDFRKYGDTKSEVFSLNWYFILGILTGFIMLIISFEAISAEKRAGTLRLLSIYGFKRQTILWYKYICYMLLYLIITIPPALVSMILFFALTGTWSLGFMGMFLLILLLSIPFASFFVWIGILISMSKNYRSAIVLVVFIWLLFVIIIPQSANIISKQLAPMKTSSEYSEMQSKAWNEEWDRLVENADPMDGVGSNSNLKSGTRARGVNSIDKNKFKVVEIELADSKKQIEIKRNIAAISPFAQFETISEIIFDKGYYLLNYQLQTLRSQMNTVKNLMIAQDARDETSLHLVYSWAHADYGVMDQIPFSGEKFEHPDLLWVTDIQTDDVATKALKILLRLLPILLLNIILIVRSVVKLERLDIR